MGSSALNFKSLLYPARYEGRVPKRIRMNKTVINKPLTNVSPFALVGNEYECFVNSHGDVFAIVHEYNLLLGDDEFEVLEYHPI